MSGFEKMKMIERKKPKTYQNLPIVIESNLFCVYMFGWECQHIGWHHFLPDDQGHALSLKHVP